MICETITIRNTTGLHTRPAKRVVDEAKKFESDIIVRYREKEASLKSLLKILKLGISYGHEIEIQCEGSDEILAMEKIKSFILNLEE
ncbi:MAG: HPr family phosphocarrier protein [Spirochaetia bacterium]|jgi:phosphotransferase system HPr (HPr) family protein|nr:HPr family phosphocarrier protein [Spirochaetia bacterium]